MRWEILDTCGDPVGIERVGGNDTVDLMVTEQGRQSAASLTPALCRQLGNELLKAANEMTPGVHVHSMGTGGIRCGADEMLMPGRGEWTTSIRLERISCEACRDALAMWKADNETGTGRLHDAGPISVDPKKVTHVVDPVTLPDADDGPLGAEAILDMTNDLSHGELEFRWSGRWCHGHDYFIARVENYKAIDEDTAKALNQVGLGVGGTKPLAMVFAASLYLAYKIPHYEGANPLASTTRRVTLNLDNVKGLVYETWLHPRSKTP